MAKSNRNLRLLPSEETPAVEKELEAIHGKITRGVSLLRVLARAVADMGDAGLVDFEESLRVAVEHLDGAASRMEGALLRLRQEQ